MAMTNKELRRKAHQFGKTYLPDRADFAGLRQAVEKLGYTVVDFNHIYNDEAVQQLIDALQLSEQSLRSRGFTYADANYRLVFVHEDLSEEEKRMVLAHEAGHIYLGHMTCTPILGQDVREEFEANEFAHYLTADPLWAVRSYITKHRKAVAVLCAGLLLAAAVTAVVALVVTQRQYYGEYYVTSTGNKYHEEECIFVKDKNTVRRLTVEEFESGAYEPCRTCLP